MLTAVMAHAIQAYFTQVYRQDADSVAGKAYVAGYADGWAQKPYRGDAMRGDAVRPYVSGYIKGVINHP